MQFTARHLEHFRWCRISVWLHYDFKSLWLLVFYCIFLQYIVISLINFLCKSLSSVQPLYLGDTIILSAATCTFENGLCGWTQSTADSLDWTSYHGKTPSHNTGPDFDHTSLSTSGIFTYIVLVYNMQILVVIYIVRFRRKGYFL